MAEAPVRLVPMVVLDPNGNYQTVYAPQSLAAMSMMPHAPGPSLIPVPVGAHGAMPPFIPVHALAGDPAPGNGPTNGGNTHSSSSVKDGLARLKVGTKIYVANLPAGMKDAEFKALFAEHGPIVKATLVKRRRTTTFGFIQFAAREMAQAAIAAKNGITFEGRCLSVQLADGEKDPVNLTRSLRVSNLPHAATRDQVEAIFSRFGTLTLCHVDKRKDQLVTAYLEYGTLEEAAAAQDALHCLCMPNQDPPLEVEFLKTLPDLSVLSQAPRGSPHGRNVLESPDIADSSDCHPAAGSTSNITGHDLAYLSTAQSDTDSSNLPLAEYIENMIQHYVNDTPPVFDGQPADSSVYNTSSLSGSAGWTCESSAIGSPNNAHAVSSTGGVSSSTSPAAPHVPSHPP